MNGPSRSEPHAGESSVLSKRILRESCKLPTANETGRFRTEGKYYISLLSFIIIITIAGTWPTLISCDIPTDAGSIDQSAVPLGNIHGNPAPTAQLQRQRPAVGLQTYRRSVN